MATDFFERQAAARKSTASLIGLFVLAVIGIVGAVYLAASVGTAYLAEAASSSKEMSQLIGSDYPWQIPIGAALFALLLIVCGSLFKITILRAGGGTGVAESLGGRRLMPGTTDPVERRVLNVVEEMAIASGTPVPPVFLMDEAGINAFAAGYSPSDAVVGVTRGCAEALSRDELQGVIAHEFSHILNGDMRMGIRLIGVLHGVLLLGLVGQAIFRIFFYSSEASYHTNRRSSSSNNDTNNAGSVILALLAIAVALIVIGAIGSFFGGLIKAAVSRQREYLADASAVQFTRNPAGISGALKQIAARSMGSQIKHPRAAEMSHMYFAQGVWEGFTSLMATHPPLPKRIKALEPSWDGKFPKARTRTALLDEPDRPEGPTVVSGMAGMAGLAAVGDAGLDEAIEIAAVSEAVHNVGEPLEAHREYAHELITSIDQQLVAAARDPYGARALLYGMLLDANQEVRTSQEEVLAEMADPGVRNELKRLLPAIDRLEARQRLPLVDLTLPALSAMSAPQYQRFARTFRALVLADDRLSLFEWVLSQLLMRHLRPKFERVRSPRIDYFALGQMGPVCSVILSSIAHSGGHAEKAFAAGREKLTDVSIELLPPEQCSMKRLREALSIIARVAVKHRGRVIDAAAAAICSDNKVDVQEVELLRGMADLLDCPMPPLLAGQPVAAS